MRLDFLLSIWRKCHNGELVFPGSIDNYFPDYQFGCCMITLLNNHMAKRAAQAAFFVRFLDEQPSGLL